MAQVVASYTTDWLDLVFRWFHVTAAIVWIGTSFYFVALDNHLREPERESDREEGVGGESWEIHGGGFYVIRKFRVAPPRLPKPLHWYKWEAYWTWLSGFALFCVLYYADARLRLIDPSVADLKPWQAILISVALLAAGWLVYDATCRLLASRPLLLALCILGLVTATAYGVGQLYQSRAAYLQVGSMLGTIMAANVFFVIIPGHRELVEALKAGREPDPRAGIAGKQRSVHNNYLTLPVLFTMLAGHFTVHLQPRPRLGGARRADGGRSRDPPLLQQTPRRRDALVDPRRLRAGDRRDRRLAAPAGLGARPAGSGPGAVRTRAAGGRRPLPAVPLAAPDLPGDHGAAARGRVRHARTRSGPGPRRSRSSPSRRP